MSNLAGKTALVVGAVGARCTAVAAGWIDTALTEGLIESLGDPAKCHRQIGGRTAKPSLP
ncbi:MAG: hypothetical protein AAFP68_01440 [Pseudomonadota bacterium]